MRKSTRTSRLVKTTKSKLDSTVHHRVNGTPKISKIVKPLHTNKPTNNRASSDGSSSDDDRGSNGSSSDGGVATGKKAGKKFGGRTAVGKQTASPKSKKSHSHTPYEKVVNVKHHEVADIASLFAPYSVNVLCDGINLTAHLLEDEQDIFQKRLASYKGSLKVNKGSQMKPYRNGKNICDGDVIIAKLRYKPFSKNVGYLLLHVNPSKITEDQVLLLRELLVYLLNDEPWDSFVGRARISLVDIAVDVKGVSIGSLIPIPGRATDSGNFTHFYKNGRLRLYKLSTQYVGESQSEKSACIYDKAEELRAKIGLTGNTAQTRIEVQFKPRVRGKFSFQPPTVSTLCRRNNPLQMLSFAEYSKEAEADDFLKLATALSVYIGATTVLQLVRDKVQKAQVKAHLSKPLCLWWQPGEYWPQFLEGLKVHPLFATGLAVAG